MTWVHDLTDVWTLKVKSDGKAAEWEKELKLTWSIELYGELSILIFKSIAHVDHTDVMRGEDSFLAVFSSLRCAQRPRHATPCLGTPSNFRMSKL